MPKCQRSHAISCRTDTGMLAGLRMQREVIILKTAVARAKPQSSKERIVRLKIRYPESLWVMFFLCALAQKRLLLVASLREENVFWFWFILRGKSRIRS